MIFNVYTSLLSGTIVCKQQKKMSMLIIKNKSEVLYLQLDIMIKGFSLSLQIQR